eukprot:s5853_g5.t1
MTVHPRQLRAVRFAVALAAVASVQSFVGVLSPRRSLTVLRRGEGFDAAAATPKVKSTISREQLERDSKAREGLGRRQPLGEPAEEMPVIPGDGPEGLAVSGPDRVERQLTFRSGA